MAVRVSRVGGPPPSVFSRVGSLWLGLRCSRRGFLAYNGEMRRRWTGTVRRVHSLVRWTGVAACLLVAAFWIAGNWWNPGRVIRVGRCEMYVGLAPGCLAASLALAGPVASRLTPRALGLRIDFVWDPPSNAYSHRGDGERPPGWRREFLYRQVDEFRGWSYRGCIIPWRYVEVATAALTAAAWLMRRRVDTEGCPDCRYSRLGLAPECPCPECGRVQA